MQGPLPFEEGLRRLDQDDREAWRKLVKEREGRSAGTQAFLALCWVDGQRSDLDIAGLVAMEVGVRDVELLLQCFCPLEKLGHVSFA